MNTVNPSPVETRMMRSIEEGFAPGAAEQAKAMMQSRIPASRYGEQASHALAGSIRPLGLKMGRLKTGTPPRLDRRSIDFDAAVARGAFRLEPGDDTPVPLSFVTRRLARPL